MKNQSFKRFELPIWFGFFVFALLWVYFSINIGQWETSRPRPLRFKIVKSQNIPIAQSINQIDIRHQRSINANKSNHEPEEDKTAMNEQNIKKPKNETRNTHKINSEKEQHFPNYYDDGLHPIWKFNTSKMYDISIMKKWSEPVPVKNKTGQGENGSGYVASKAEEKLMNVLVNKLDYNLLASNKISLHRSLPDYRFPECRNVQYPEHLPTTSVIIVVHDEIWSLLLRTVWSIIERSPRTLLEEIILVDDASTYPFLKKPLDDYVKELPVSVSVIRTKKREGLIRARLIGARAAKGSVLTFFDAHMEVTEGWLPPILSRISSDRSVVAVPFLDALSQDDMKYVMRYDVQSFGLRWNLIFFWTNKFPERELKRTQNDRTAPKRIPNHVGCAFSIDREFFFEIGSYDECMDIWGGENIEMAFRTWMCGGSMELIPCSRAAHLYRRSTYSFNADKDLIIRRNNVRVAEVWMDEFKELYYATNPAIRRIAPGNLTDRIELRKQLQCKSFRWYLENVYPESNWLMSHKLVGELTNEGNGTKCLNWNFKLNACKNESYQLYNYAETGQIVSTEDFCIGSNNQTIIAVGCSKNDSSQLWDYEDKRKLLINRQNHLCLYGYGESVKMGTCDADDKRFKWSFNSNMLNNKLLKKVFPNLLTDKLNVDSKWF